MVFQIEKQLVELVNTEDKKGKDRNRVREGGRERSLQSYLEQ